MTTRWRPPQEALGRAAPMMTIEALTGASVNLEVAREALHQAEKLLKDALATKEAFDRRAQFFLTAYIALALAVFGWAGALHQAGAGAFWAPTVAGFCLVGGALSFLWALRDYEYGTLGSGPEMWLRPGVIDGDGSKLGQTLAYVAFYHDRRIDISRTSNREKATWIRRGIYAGLASPVALIVLALCFNG